MIIGGYIATMNLLKSKHNQISSISIKQPDFEFIANQRIILHKKFDRFSMLVYSEFYTIFKMIPEYIYIDRRQMIILLREEDFVLYNNNFNKYLDEFLKRFPNYRIFFKIYSDRFGLFIFNLFSHIGATCFSNLYFNSEKEESELSIYLEIDDKNIPQAIGKNGRYIHFINNFLQNLEFGRIELENNYPKKVVYVRQSKE